MLCRICLNNNFPLVGIFSEDGVNHQLADKIRMCLQLQVQKEDRISNKVCCKCFINVNEFFSFWKKARESHNLLQKIQKDVPFKKSTSWCNDDTDNKERSTSPDILDMIDMETATRERQPTNIWKQPRKCDNMKNATGIRLSKGKDGFPHNRKNKLSSGKNPVQSQSQRSFKVHHLDSKQKELTSKHFSFVRPSMTYNLSKEVQVNVENTWEEFQAVKSEPKRHMADKENQHENITSSFSFSTKSNSSKDANSHFEQKPHNTGSQLIFSSNDELSFPNIPLSLFSSSDDKKQTSLFSKTSIETNSDENLQDQSPIIGTSKVKNDSQKPDDAEMTPRSKVMKMLNREIW